MEYDDGLEAPCKQPGCKFLAKYKGYCKKHKKEPYKSHRGARLPDDWRIRLAYVLKRDDYICYLCGKPGADSVDHVRPGDDHEYENLKAVHENVYPHCHRHKTSREGNLRQGHNVADKPVAKKSSYGVNWGL